MCPKIPCDPSVSAQSFLGVARCEQCEKKQRAVSKPQKARLYPDSVGGCPGTWGKGRLLGGKYEGIAS